MAELNRQVEDYVNGQKMQPNVYPYQIAFNVLPHIDSFLENGYTKEEMKLVNETKKIMNDPDIMVSPTAVRIPVFRSHSESINIETEKTMPDFAGIVEILRNAPGVEVVDNIENEIYPMPILAQNTGKVYVGRIRRDFTVNNGLNLWVVSDNLLKGAALNAVQIAELLYERNWLKYK
jgi:aspartate-semialdehyde dehydrogenase